MVLVTGAGGSIGAELCRQIARFRPARLVLFDISEAALYEIQIALADAFPQLPLVCVVGDVKHAALVDAVLARERPQRRLPRRGVQARAADGGDQRLAGGAQQRLRHLGAGARGGRGAKVEKFVLVSTDKAVNPTNVMGASKRLAEIVCQSLAGRRRRSSCWCASATCSAAPAA